MTEPEKLRKKEDEKMLSNEELANAIKDIWELLHRTAPDNERCAPLLAHFKGLLKSQADRTERKEP